MLSVFLFILLCNYFWFICLPKPIKTRSSYLIFMTQFEFKFPDVGEGIHEGTIVKWLVKKGDTVKQDQVLAEVETDKAVVEIPSPVAGKVLSTQGAVGTVVKVGQTLITFDVVGALPKINVHGAPVTPEKSGGVVGQIPDSMEALGGVATSAATVRKSSLASSASLTGVKATPFVRKLAEELGVDISTVKGTSVGGVITADDVKKAAKIGSSGTSGMSSTSGVSTQSKPADSAPKVVKKYDMWGYVDHVPLKGMRKVIAVHMEEARNAPVVTHTDEADVTDLSVIREAAKKTAEKKGVKLTYLPYIVKALIEALKKHPLLNSELDRYNEDIIVKKYFNIGIAVDTGDGLVVPVVKGADKKDLFAIAGEIEQLAVKAKDKKLDLMDMKGGTITITNVGSLGGLFFTPILNSPESAILGLGKLQDKPVVRDGKIVVRKILPISLTFDHRVVDGAEAARFVTDLISVLGSPKDLK